MESSYRIRLVATDVLITVVLPILVGSIFYIIAIDQPIFKIVKGYLPDGLWSFSFTSCILIIWNRRVHLLWANTIIVAAILFEFFQYQNWIEGTGDIVDVSIYIIFFLLSILSNSIIRNKYYYHETR